MISVLHVFASPAAAAVQLLPLLADAAIKGVVIFGVAACAVALCRRRSAATRHAIWSGAVVAQLTLPVLSGLLPAWRVPLVDRLDRRFSIVPETVLAPVSDEDPLIMVAPVAEVGPIVIAGSMAGSEAAMARSEAAMARSEAAMVRSQAAMARSQAAMARSVARAAAKAARHAHAATTIGFGGGDFAGPVSAFAPAAPRFLRGRSTSSWLRLVGIVWLLGAMGIFGRFLAGTIAVSRLARRSERVEDGRWLSLAQRIAIRLGVARPMTLLRSGRFGIPVTWGIVYPVVLLPDDADDWTDERRRYVLVHEMAHVKRVDAFTQLVAQLAIAMFWFDPFVWIAAHRMRVEREHACDDYVLREGTPASTYAADLLAMVRALGTRGRAAQPAFAALAMARPDELESRMNAILDPAQDRRTLRSAPALGLALCSLLLLLPLAAFRPFGDRPTRSFEARAWSPDPVPIGIPSPPPIPIPTIPAIPAEEFAKMQENLRSAASSREFADLQDDLKAASAAIEEVRAARAATKAMAAASATVASVAGSAVVATTPGSSWSTTSTASCSSVSLRRSGTSTSIHSSSDDDDNRSFQYISSSAGRCLQVAVWGAVEFSSDERSIRSVSRDGRVYVRERRPNSDREVEVTAGEGSEPRYAYSVDGERASFETEGREWLESVLPDILRESGLNATAHVARLRREGGVSAVLSDIALTQSTSAKRAAYEALLHGGLSETEAARVARQAGTDLASSDGELRAVLAEIGKMGRQSRSMADALGTAVEHMSSDGEKRAVLQQYALEGDRDMLLVTMRQAKSISSDGEKSAFLRAVVARYLSTDDESLWKEFFDVTQTISSDGEKRAVLTETLQYAQRPAVLLSVLDVTRQISSDGEKSELLVGILRRHLLSSGPLREAFMRTTRTLSSDAEYRRVMEVAIAS
jgi:beta-lactamase regulating signal transducer with metallopeptidase domain